jgi:IMP cyclohydrolase
MDARSIARQNFERHLRQNAYPGRGLVIGRSDAHQSWIQIYWIMGRSAHSRNRRFVVEGTTVRTEAVDASLVRDPSLIIYAAMLELPGIYLVSNGDQTATLYQALRAGETFDAALATREREPDAPNYTPRISGMLNLNDPLGPITLSILKANLLDPAHTDRFTYRPAQPLPGTGYAISTYMGNGDPLPSFVGDPLVVPCTGSAQQILTAYWEALNQDNRISLAVKEIPIDGRGSDVLVRNRFVKL